MTEGSVKSQNQCGIHCIEGAREMRSYQASLFLPALLGMLLVPSWSQQTPLPVLVSSQNQTPEQHKNARLILKDGSYQLAREYHIEGDRVIYFSIERSEQEELPCDLVDWPATERWAVDHGANSRAESPGMKAAAELDREQQAEHEEEAARRPEIAPGLRLPDVDEMFIVDKIHNKVEAVEIPQTTGTGSLTGRNVIRAEAASLFAKRRPISLAGGEAKVRVHELSPVFYLGLPDAEDAQAPEGALTVDTHGASSTQSKQPSPAESRFVLVKAEERVGERRIPAAILNLADLLVQPNVSQADQRAAEGRVWPMLTTPLVGGHWMKLQVRGEIEHGEYAVVEFIKAGVVNTAVWDFAVDPSAPENAHAIETIAP